MPIARTTRAVDGMEASVNGLSTDGRAVVLLGFEGGKHDNVRDKMEIGLTLCRTAGGNCDEVSLSK